MRRRRRANGSVLTLALALALPGAATAQVVVRVDWSVGDENVHVQGAWSNAPLPRALPPRAVLPVRSVEFVPVRGVRVPPGHRPRRGQCRLWYPGLPPGHQPPPTRCTALRGAFHPEVLIVTWRGVVQPVWRPGPRGVVVGGAGIRRAVPRTGRIVYGITGRIEGDGWARGEGWHRERRRDRDGWEDDRWDDDRRGRERAVGPKGRGKGPRGGRGKGRGRGG